MQGGAATVTSHPAWRLHSLGGTGCRRAVLRRSRPTRQAGRIACSELINAGQCCDGRVQPGRGAAGCKEAPPEVVALAAGWAAPRAVTPRMRAGWARVICTAARLHRVSHSRRLPSSHPVPPTGRNKSPHGAQWKSTRSAKKVHMGAASQHPLRLYSVPTAASCSLHLVLRPWATVMER